VPEERMLQRGRRENCERYDELRKKANGVWKGKKKRRIRKQLQEVNHRDLGIETVTDIIAKFAKSLEKRLQDHINIEASRLLSVNNITRRLKRKKPLELVIR
jgi:uncharacterized protein YeeX (DUF496 family)